MLSNGAWAKVTWGKAPVAAHEGGTNSFWNNKTAGKCMMLAILDTFLLFAVLMVR
jgi:hypothetical protein